MGVASTIFLLAVFLVLAALLGTLATGLVRLLGLGILALFAAFVINMARNGTLPNISFSNPFSPSAQQIPTAETASPPAASFDTAQPPSSNGGELGSTGSTAGGTAGSTTGGTAGGTSASFNTVPGGAAATGANANTTGGTRTTGTSQPTSTRPGVPALW